MPNVGSDDAMDGRCLRTTSVEEAHLPTQPSLHRLSGSSWAAPAAEPRGQLHEQLQRHSPHSHIEHIRRSSGSGGGLPSQAHHCILHLVRSTNLLEIMRSMQPECCYRNERHLDSCKQTCMCAVPPLAVSASFSPLCRRVVPAVELNQHLIARHFPWKAW